MINLPFAVFCPGAYSTGASTGSMEYAVASIVEQQVNRALTDLRIALVQAVEESATLDGPCFLCKAPRPDCDALPVDNYGGKTA